MTKKKEEVIEEVKKEESEIEVGNPQELRPQDLPLVIKPKGGKWKNAAQEEYAATLNGYAYSNPTKWEAKKDVLVARLADLEKNPGNIAKYRGNESNIIIKNKLHEK